MVEPIKRLELLFWAVLPAFITLLLAAFCITPKYASGLNSFMPMLPLIPIFYWGLTYPREMSYWFVFALGIITDVAEGTPIGLSSLLYLFFLALLRAQRKYIVKEGFVLQWGYFAALLLLLACAQWLWMALLHDRPQPMVAPLLQWLLTLCCYPLLHKLFDALASHIENRRWRILHGH